MGFLTKLKQGYKEKKAERAELNKAYKEEYAKEKAIQEAGRRLIARGEAKERARAKARAPPLSEKLKKGADRLAVGVGKAAASGLKKISEMDKQPATKSRAVKPREARQQSGIENDFLGIGGGSSLTGNPFGGVNFFGTPAKKKKRKSKPRQSSQTLGFGGWF